MSRSEYILFGLMDAAICMVDSLNHVAALGGKLFHKDEFADIVEQAGHESFVFQLLPPFFPLALLLWRKVRSQGYGAKDRLLNRMPNRIVKTLKRP